MNYPKINIITDYSADLEAQYLCFLAKGISIGEYQDNGFAVTPTLEYGNAKTVHFPNLPYSKNFWRTTNFNPNINFSTQYPKTAIDEIKNLLVSYDKNDYSNEIEKIKKDWLKIEKPFFNDINTFLDLKKALSKINRIDILITPFGALGSFNPSRVGNKFNLNVTSRVDFPAGNICAGILQNLYIIENSIGGEIGDEKYLKRMSAINFIFENTIFKKYYPKFKNLIKPQFTFSGELLNKSDRYLIKLGFPQKDTSIDVNNKVFSKQEKDLLSTLIKNKGKIVTFDKAANTLWKNNTDDKFSLEAMAKVIQSIRKKIKGLGINKEVIFTKRGKGYSLS